MFVRPSVGMSVCLSNLLKFLQLCGSICLLQPVEISTMNIKGRIIPFAFLFITGYLNICVSMRVKKYLNLLSFQETLRHITFLVLLSQVSVAISVLPLVIEASNLTPKVQTF